MTLSVAKEFSTVPGIALARRRPILGAKSFSTSCVHPRFSIEAEQAGESLLDGPGRGMRVCDIVPQSEAFGRTGAKTLARNHEEC